MPKIYIALAPSDPEFLTEHRERLREFAEVVQNPEERRPTDEEKLAACRDVDAVIVGRSGGGLTQEIVHAAEKLKVVGVVGGSVRMAQPEFVLDQGIAIFNAGWAMADSVAEFTLAMMLCGLRDIPHMIDVLRSDGWGRARKPLDVAGKAVGLVGFGMIARRVAEFLQPFRNEIRVYDPYVTEDALTPYGARKAGLEDLLRNSFVVSLHAGSTPETEGMLGAKELALIPDDGLLVNTARAAIVDEDALVAELKSGRIRAALNVFWKEPLPKDHPLRGLDNVILTPHGGGLTQDRQARQSRSIAEDMGRFFRGETPKCLVTREMVARMT